MQPKLYFSYARKKPCALTALFYLEKEIDLYGWYLVAGSECLSHAFFMIENFYSETSPVLYRSLADDVYAPWTMDYPPAQSSIRCPLPAEIGHELERMQSRFIDEWLFFQNDVGVSAEAAAGVAAEFTAYRAHSLPVQKANIRWRKMQSFDMHGDVWRHVTAGADANVAEFLEKHWRMTPVTMPGLNDLLH